MKNKKWMLLLCSFLFVALLATGCRPAQRPAPEPRVPDNQRIQEQNTPMNRTNEPMNDRNAPRNMQPNEMNQDLSIRADRIVNEIVAMPEVRSATVVITDNTAVIGVNLTEDTKGEINTDIKRQIEEVVRQTDRNIDRVTVSADPDIFRRIENIARETGRGRPLSGFGREIEEIIRRITPGA